MTSSFRNATPDQLAAALQDARDYTLKLFACLAAEGFDVPAQVPVLPIVNPPLWELGHIAWFAEWYVLRDARSSAPDAAQRPSLLSRGDAWFDSNRVSHEERWKLNLPGAGALKTYCHEVLDRVLDKLAHAAADDEALYPYRLVLAHEDMHGEALAYTIQTLEVSVAPNLIGRPIPNWAQGEIRFPGGSFEFGSRPDSGFVFDNEKWAHVRRLPPFTIDSTLVSNGQFIDFIEDGGYQNPHYWTRAGRDWLMQQECSAPRGWLRDGRRWLAQHFGHVSELAPHHPVRHVNLYEAQAYCAWANRRLPTEEEWEYAAVSGHPAFRWGDLWEWTCSRFEPYPGFEPDAYREYSAPWFSSHQVLRAASFVTPDRMRSPHFRNFYLPERSDPFFGFRTCAL